MAKKKVKSKEFILYRDKYGRMILRSGSNRIVRILGGSLIMCHQTFKRFFGIELKIGEKQRVEINITLKTG